MAPRPRRVHPNTQANENSVVHERVTDSTTANNLQGPKKRTFSTTDPTASASTAAREASGPPPNKRARNTGPSHGRPMQLRSMGERNIEIEQADDTTADSAGKGKTRALTRTSLVAPPRHPTPIPVQFPPPFPTQNLDPTPVDKENGNIDSDDSGVETEKEWLDDSQLVEFAQRFPTNALEALAFERPSWQGSSDTPAAASGRVGVSFSEPEAGFPPLQVGSVSVTTAVPGSANVGVPFSEASFPPSQAGSVSVTTAVPGSANVGVPFSEASFPPSQAGSVSTATASLVADIGNISASQGVSGGNEVDAFPHPNPPRSWSNETDIVFIPGTTRIMLTQQHPVLRAVLQDSFEELKVYLLLTSSFPDAVSLPSVLRDCLISAATDSQYPLASDIRTRLHQDELYTEQLSRLTCKHIPFFRAEVKDRCLALVRADFQGIHSPSTVAQAVTRQLSGYAYTFPMAMNNDPICVVPMRTKPYRNFRLIEVIRDLYFSGGFNSFANQYRPRFPRTMDKNGMPVYEVPVAMVALVATALYAAIHEWQTGSHHSTEFSTNTYLDVYNGHVQTFNYILQNRNGSFHRMMADIYMRVSEVQVTPPPGAPIAELNLEELDD